MSINLSYHHGDQIMLTKKKPANQIALWALADVCELVEPPPRPWSQAAPGVGHSPIVSTIAKYLPTENWLPWGSSFLTKLPPCQTT